MRNSIRTVIRIVLFPFKFLIKEYKFVLLLLLAYIGFKTFDYLKNANSFDEGAFCDNFYKQSLDFNGQTFCLDATKSNQDFQFNKKYNSIILLAREHDSERAYTGHGWLVWMQSEQIDSSTIRIHEFIPAGYGGVTSKVKWNKNQINFYENHIKPNIPVNNQEIVGRILSALALGPEKIKESSTVISKNNPVDIKLTEISSIFQANNFGDNPSIMANILIDEEDYNNSKIYYEDYSSKDFHLFYHDCTTLLLNMTNNFGLYRPPRILCPYPEQTIKLLMETNLEN